MVFNCNSYVTGLLNVMSHIIAISCAQDSCLLTNGSGLPVFKGYGVERGQPGEPDSRIHHQHQAIIPSYKFNCCGIITEWGVDLNPDNGLGTFNFILQVWRPDPAATDTSTSECHNLADDYGNQSISLQNDTGNMGKVARVTPSPQNQLQFQIGDVLGFYVESNGNGSDSDNGVVVLNDNNHTSELVWHASVDIAAQPSQSGSCPYPIGTNGVLNTSTHAAPVISISVMTTSCPTIYSSLVPTTSTPLPNLRGTVPESLSGGLIAGVMVAIFVVMSIIAIIIIIAVIVKQHSMTTKHTGIALSNQVYYTPERNQLNATYACPDGSSKLIIPVSMTQRDDAQHTRVHTEEVLYHSVGPDTARRYEGSDGLYTMNQVNQYAEVANQYAVISLEGQESGATGRNGEYETSDHNKEAMANEMDLFNVAGVYVPTTEERCNLEDHYEIQNVNIHIYNKLTFFVEDKVYWAPASTTSDLYSQLASKKYREIPRGQIRTLSELGSGEFGNVSKAQWSISGTTKEVAIKTLKPGSSENDRVRFLQEAAIMGQFNHLNIVKLYGVVTMEDPIIICFELMVNGNLRDYLGTLSPNSGMLKELNLLLLRFSRQIALGMAYLSKKAFVHRDLAARNILLDEALTCKISDFGMARDLADSTYYTVQSKGGKIPVKWTAPEALFYKRYSIDSDVWSYGMVLFEIWSVGKKPFSELSNSEVLRTIKSGYCQPPPPGCPRSLYQLMVDCWNPIHSHRPPFSKISATLNASSNTLLQWTSDCSVAGELGGQLSEALFLYQDLQNSYLQ